MQGFAKTWCFRSRIDFKLSSMTKIYKRPTSLSAPWLRTFGIYIPWLVVGGEFRRRGKRKFWCSRYKRDSIVIELEDEEFHRLVLNVADVNQEIDMLLEKISSLTFKFSYDLFL